MSNEQDYTPEDKFITNGYSIENRIIYVTTINESRMAAACRAVNVMMGIDPEAPIKVVINSYGGSVYDGLALYDKLRSLDCLVLTHCEGKAMSMGLIIFMAGDYRSCSENATFMAHEASGNSGHEKEKDKEADVIEHKRLNLIGIDILASYTKKKHKYWTEAIKTDFYFNKDTAIKLGVINA